MIQRLVVRRRGRRSEMKNFPALFAVLALCLFCSATRTTVNGFIVVGQKQNQKQQQRAQLSSTTSRISFRQEQQQGCRTSPFPASVDRNRNRINDLIICRRSGSRDDDSSSSSTTTKSNDEEQKKIDIVDAVFKGKSGSSKNASVDIDDDNALLVDKIDGFLDKSFFDPDEYDDDDDSFFGKFAQLVKSDYELFEAAFVACFFLLLITVAKDLLRAQMVHSAVTSSGRLF